MSDQTTPSQSNVSFTADEALQILNTLAGAAVAIDPKAAGAVAVATGIATLIRNTIVPAIQHLGVAELTVADQAALAAESAAERAKVGAPPTVLD